MVSFLSQTLNMFNVHKSIPAIIPKGNHFSITTDGKFLITSLSPYLISITGKELDDCRDLHVKHFFIRASLAPDASLLSASTTGFSFYIKARIQSKAGNAI